MDIIKIDVDGREREVLDGAADTIDRCHPAIVIEVGDGSIRALQPADEQAARPYGFYAFGVLARLRAKGYRLYHEHTKAEVLDDAELIANYKFDLYTLNIIAMPKGRDCPSVT